MLEIERKYLLDKFPAAAAGAPVEEIEQGWIPGERLRERLRRVTTAGSVRWYRTVKTGAGVVRTEIEEETTREIFEAMWPLTESRRIHKQRHRVTDGDLTWEIDHFLDRDLTLAEVELPSLDVLPVPPDWLAGAHRAGGDGGGGVLELQFGAERRGRGQGSGVQVSGNAIGPPCGGPR